jgi:hypothetical protein
MQALVNLTFTNERIILVVKSVSGKDLISKHPIGVIDPEANTQ